MFDNLPFKIYTDDTAAKLATKIASLNLKEVKGDGTFEVIATTEGIDRDGEIIRVDGWDFDNFMKNPIILWGHNYYDMDAVIGAATEVKVEGKQVIVRGIFANTEAGQQAKQLYDDGILKAVSVGFIPKERQGNVITKAELLELSFVSVPANPEALSLAKLYKLDTLVKTIVEDGEAAEEEEKQDKDDDKEKPEGDGHAAAEGSEEAPEGEEADDDGDEDKEDVEDDEKKGMKAGRVLSQKNRDLVVSVMEGLQQLLDASEPEKAHVREAAEAAKRDMQAIQKYLENGIKQTKSVLENL